MPVFEYTALNDKGKRISGIMDAESAPIVRQKLRSSGIFPVQVAEAVDAATRKEGGFSFHLGLFSGLRLSEISMLTRQLAILINAGFTIVEAIDSLLRQAKKFSHKKLLARIKDAILEGQSLTDALSQFQNLFSPLYINMVHAGETSGTLEIVLDRLADISEKQVALQGRIKSALVYPVFMSIICGLVLFLLMSFIVPNITSIFVEMNQALPLPTRLLITISDLLKNFWWVVPTGIIPLIMLWKVMKNTARGRYFKDRILLMIPLVRTLVKKLSMARFAGSMRTMLENGITMLPALDIVKHISGNAIIADEIETVSIEIEKGAGLGGSLEKYSSFPDIGIQMVAVGERGGELEVMLGKIADIFERDVEAGILRATSLLEPLLILVMGGVVGFIVLSICLPIFEMNTLIG